MSVSPLGDRDAACPVCGTRAGSHTLDQLAGCMAVTTRDDTYKDDFRERFQIPADVLVADHLDAKALVLHGQSNVPAVSFDPRAGQFRVDSPAVLCEFGTSASGPVESVAKVLFVASEDGMRGFGRLLRDTANGAVNAAARAQGMSPRDVKRRSRSL